MANSKPSIQIRSSGKIWQILQHGTVRAFALTYRSAELRAAQLQGGAV